MTSTQTSYQDSHANSFETTVPLDRKKILVIEDDRDIADLIYLHLSDVYENVDLCHDGRQGLEMALSQQWDLILLDIRLPGLDGLEICRQLRAENSYTPILMVTSKSSELDHVLGLEMGADDYVTKPFSILTLMSRVKAILRRMSVVTKKEAVPESSDQLGFADISVDVSRRNVIVGEKTVELTAREFDLLVFFMRQPGKVFSRAELLDKVWGYGHEGYEHTVNSHINRLRTKIESNPTHPTYLVTVWGVGYKLGA